MRRSGSEVVVRLTTLALLSALAFVLMAFVRIPYPGAPWLQIEISDLCVLIAYAMYGFWGGFSVAVLKTVLDLAVHGLTDPLGVGHMTALLTSLIFVFGLFLTSHVFKMFKKGLCFRILAYVIITLIVSVMLTGLNALFITPSYLSAFGEHPHYSTCFTDGTIEGVVGYFHSMEAFVGLDSYFLLIFVIYFPFNLLKCVSCCAIYELIFNRLIFVLMTRSPKMRKYFLGPVFRKSEEEQKEENQRIEDSLNQKQTDMEK